ncbi:helix-turn-helix domain-containing protein [Dactylosporangium vinaceum]|uniref:Helix-turn-helix domain-containing protein n=1 Tax=Dactylosporangium vinaceum TaxID=53362 RepID=A0ABV5M2T3_9ACTN|nr:helix-turn-helix transcriptional regulator [Dactylosporangium vinaceum]UAB96346.1 helix-turn-helix domain-containing protein [Dactylosporangium vinaceum]
MATTVKHGASQNTDVVPFGALLRQWRHRRNWSQRELGAVTFFSREYVGLIERGERRPTANFVERAEAALGTDGALRNSFTLLQHQRATDPQRQQARHQPQSPGAARADPEFSAPASQHRDIPAMAKLLDHLMREVIAGVSLDGAPARLDGLPHRDVRLPDGGDLIIAAQDRVRAAAVALEACIDLLHGPVADAPHRSAAVLAARFAAMIVDALAELGYATAAQGWTTVVELLGPVAVQGQVGAATGSGEVAHLVTSYGSAANDTVPAGRPKMRRAATGRRPAVRLPCQVGRRTHVDEALVRMVNRIELAAVKSGCWTTRAPPCLPRSTIRSGRMRCGEACCRSPRVACVGSLDLPGTCWRLA